MRPTGMKKTDWIGVMGILLLLAGAPGYLAQDADSRALGAWQDFQLPPPRIGDRVVLDLVVQETGKDPVRARSVLEVVHRAPEAGEVPVAAVFVQEVRFHPHHVDLGALVLRQDGSVLTEYYDDRARVVWRTVERVVEKEGEVYAQDEAERVAHQSWTTWLQGLPQQAVAHRSDAQVTVDRLILQRSEFLYEKIVLPSLGGTPVRDRLVYGDVVVYGGSPTPIATPWGVHGGPIPCQNDDPEHYIGAGGIHYPSGADIPQVRTAVPVMSDDPASLPAIEAGPLSSGPHKLGIGTDSVMYFPATGWAEPQVVLAVGPHRLPVGTSAGIGLCQGGEEHPWYHPDVPFPAGYHVSRSLRPAGNVSVHVDLLPSHIEKGSGRVLDRDQGHPFLLTQTSGIAFSGGTRPERSETSMPVRSETPPPLPFPRSTPGSFETSPTPFDPAGPQLPLSGLSTSGSTIAGGWSLASLHDAARNQTDLAVNETLVGFAYDIADEAGPGQWWLLYATPEGTTRILEVTGGPDEAQVATVPCSQTAYHAALEHHLYMSCQSVSASILKDDPLFTDPVWLLEDLQERAGVVPHAFSYEPLPAVTAHGREGKAPLGLLFVAPEVRSIDAAVLSGVARWTTGHIGPAHSPAVRPQEAASWGVVKLDDGSLVQEVRVAPDDGRLVMPATATQAESAPTTERAPITPLTLAAGGAGLVFVAFLLRLLAAAKASLVYPAMAALYARIERDDVLNHERRESLMHLLEADPGLTPSDVDRLLEWGWGATVHHLETLRKNGKLVRMTVGRAQHYFPLTVPDKATRLRHVVMRTDEMARFLERIETQPGLSLKELDEGSTLRRAALSKIGSKLVAYGLVHKERDGKLVRFYPTSHGAASSIPKRDTEAPDEVPA